MKKTVLLSELLSVFNEIEDVEKHLDCVLCDGLGYRPDLGENCKICNGLGYHEVPGEFQKDNNFGICIDDFYFKNDDLERIIKVMNLYYKDEFEFERTGHYMGIIHTNKFKLMTFGMGEEERKGTTFYNI